MCRRDKSRTEHCVNHPYILAHKNTPYHILDRTGYHTATELLVTIAKGGGYSGGDQ